MHTGISSTSLKEFDPDYFSQMVRGRVEEKDDIQKGRSLYKKRCDKRELMETTLNFITNTTDTLKAP